MQNLYDPDKSPPENIEDWTAFHHSRLAELDPELKGRAVNFLREYLELSAAYLRKEIAKDPQTWWAKHHFYGMMEVRNALRANGYGERDFKIDNLDDYAAGLVELAVKAVKLRPDADNL